MTSYAEDYRPALGGGLELIVSAGKAKRCSTQPAKPVPESCGACVFSFSHMPEVGLFVCDKDGQPIDLNGLPPRAANCA